MTIPTFCAIKVHYDHRRNLACHLKYSILPRPQEYKKYLTLFRENGVGGDGFHECINFAVGQSNTTRFYLPPGYIPKEKHANEEFVFFSFTYMGDEELPAHVVGVHAGAQLVSRAGRVRGKSFEIAGVDPLVFHAEAPSDLVTLIIPPLPYEVGDGIYTPAYHVWGNGLRYLEKDHAANIVREAIARGNAATLELDG